MKFVKLTRGRLMLSAALITSIIGLSSWQIHRDASVRRSQPATDTVPEKRGSDGNGRVRNIDDVIAELDRVDIDKEISQAMKSVEQTMKDFNKDKARQDVAEAMKQADEAMKQIDVQKLKADVERSIAKIDWDKIQSELDKVKQMDLVKLNVEMEKVQKELEKIGPKIQEEMQKAQVDIQKAKEDMQEYKSFLDGLQQDGLISEEAGYQIAWKNEELKINGKKADESTVRKYDSFLKKHKKFNIEKTADDFDIHVD